MCYLTKSIEFQNMTMNDQKTLTLAKWKNCSPQDLISLVNLNTSLPSHLDSPPWRMPPGNKDAAMINKLLGMDIMFDELV